MLTLVPEGNGVRQIDGKPLAVAIETPVVQ